MLAKHDRLNRAGIGIGKSLRLANITFNRAMRLELAREGVTFGQYIHLERLWVEDGISQVELSQRVGVKVASSTSVIAELERLKLIKRTRDLGDKRRLSVFLTPKGAEMEGRVLAAARRVNHVARSDLGAGELKTLFALLDKITDAVNAACPPSPNMTGED